MADVLTYTVAPDVTVNDAIDKINMTGKKAVFFFFSEDHLLGLFTDGDMRQYVLRRGDLKAPIVRAMNPTPIVLKESERSRFSELIRKYKMIVYPIVDVENRLTDAVFWNEIQNWDETFVPDQLPEEIETVIMAGGLGRRLYPYTKVLPKALIPIGEFPICTHVINNFKKYGCRRFHLVLNHKKNMIKAYYSEEKTDVDISFHEETKFLGTAGGLSLLKGKMKNAFFVSNCDILVDADYACIYKFHKMKKNKITVVGALKNVQIPYGVVNVEGKNDSSAILSIDEKPKFSFLTNVGIYIIEPEVLDKIQEGEFVHMTDIISRYIAAGEQVGVFPVPGDSWLDMGQIEEMKQMISVLEKKVSQ